MSAVTANPPYGSVVAWVVKSTVLKNSFFYSRDVVIHIDHCLVASKAFYWTCATRRNLRRLD